MPFFLLGPIRGSQADGCVVGVGAGWECSSGLDAGRECSRGVAACSLVSGVMCSGVGRVGGMTATLGTKGLDGSRSRGP